MSRSILVARAEKEEEEEEEEKKKKEEEEDGEEEKKKEERRRKEPSASPFLFGGVEKHTFFVIKNSLVPFVSLPAFYEQSTPTPISHAPSLKPPSSPVCSP